MGDRTGQSDHGVLSEDVRQAVTLIHGTSTRAVLYVTGGASQALSWLLCVPGASNTVLEAAAPYARTAMLQLLQSGTQKPLLQNMSFASASAAAALAAAAYRRAVLLAGPGDPVVGVAASCALVTNIPKRGLHRAYVAAHTDEALLEYELILQKGARDRVAEDDLSSRLIIQALVESCCSPLTVSHEHTMGLVRDRLVAGDSITPPTIREHLDPIDAILAADVDRESHLQPFNDPVDVVQLDKGRWRIGVTSTTAVLSGSFNPLHRGHKRLIDTARAALGPDAIVGYEMAVTNVDKPSLDTETVRKRSEQFLHQSAPLIISRAALFVDKARLLPNHVFIIGYDTATRLVDPRYYGGESQMMDAMVSIARSGCRFLVAGRRAEPNSGPFYTLEEIQLPAGFERLFEKLPEETFREDISSTLLRKAANEPHPP